MPVEFKNYYDVLGVAPNASDAEIKRGVAFIEALQKADGASREDALRSFCLLALNLNEFLYLD